MKFRPCLVPLTVILLAPLAVIGQNSPVVVKRPITVADDVGMMRLAPDDFAPNPSGKVAHFSPDGKRFVLVLRRGNLEKNNNDFSLLLYQTADAAEAPKADALLRMSSSSDRDAIGQIRWLADNDTLVFLGENPGEVSQVYSFNISARILKKLTNQPTTVVSYDVTEDGRTIAFMADQPTAKTADTEQGPSREIVIEGQNLDRIVAGDYSLPEGKRVLWQFQTGGISCSTRAWEITGSGPSGRIGTSLCTRS